eukprot:516854-Rhodomonas_salina.2
MRATHHAHDTRPDTVPDTDYAQRRYAYLAQNTPAYTRLLKPTTRKTQRKHACDAREHAHRAEKKPEEKEEKKKSKSRLTRRQWSSRAVRGARRRRHTRRRASIRAASRSQTPPFVPGYALLSTAPTEAASTTPLGQYWPLVPGGIGGSTLAPGCTLSSRLPSLPYAKSLVTTALAFDPTGIPWYPIPPRQYCPLYARTLRCTALVLCAQYGARRRRVGADLYGLHEPLRLQILHYALCWCPHTPASVLRKTIVIANPYAYGSSLQYAHASTIH